MIDPLPPLTAPPASGPTPGVGRAHHVPPSALPIPPEAGPGRGDPKRKRRPKDIGTADESAAVRALQRLGFPHAERRALRGRNDAGDILICPGIIAEVKGGARGRNASDGQVVAWLAETEKERVNAGAAHAFLILPRTHIGPANAHTWWAVAWTSTLLQLHDAGAPWADVPLRMHLADMCVFLTRAGYGTEMT